VRDHAILHLMAGYGLRPGEVATLKRSSIDWQTCTLKVAQSKTRSILLMPLAPDTIYWGATRRSSGPASGCRSSRQQPSSWYADRLPRPVPPP